MSEMQLKKCVRNMTIVEEVWGIIYRKGTIRLVKMSDYGVETKKIFLSRNE